MMDAVLGPLADLLCAVGVGSLLPVLVWFSVRGRTRKERRAMFKKCKQCGVPYPKPAEDPYCPPCAVREMRKVRDGVDAAIDNTPALGDGKEVVRRMAEAGDAVPEQMKTEHDPAGKEAARKVAEDLLARSLKRDAAPQTIKVAGWTCTVEPAKEDRASDRKSGWYLVQRADDGEWQLAWWDPECGVWSRFGTNDPLTPVRVDERRLEDFPSRDEEHDRLLEEWDERRPTVPALVEGRDAPCPHCGTINPEGLSRPPFCNGCSKSVLSVEKALAVEVIPSDVSWNAEPVVFEESPMPATKPQAPSCAWCVKPALGEARLDGWLFPWCGQCDVSSVPGPERADDAPAATAEAPPWVAVCPISTTEEIEGAYRWMVWAKGQLDRVEMLELQQRRYGTALEQAEGRSRTIKAGFDEQERRHCTQLNEVIAEREELLAQVSDLEGKLKVEVGRLTARLEEGQRTNKQLDLEKCTLQDPLAGCGKTMGDQADFLKKADKDLGEANSKIVQLDKMLILKTEQWEQGCRNVERLVVEAHELKKRAERAEAGRGQALAESDRWKRQAEENGKLAAEQMVAAQGGSRMTHDGLRNELEATQNNLVAMGKELELVKVRSAESAKLARERMFRVQELERQVKLNVECIDRERKEREDAQTKLAMLDKELASTRLSEACLRNALTGHKETIDRERRELATVQKNYKDALLICQDLKKHYDASVAERKGLEDQCSLFREKLNKAEWLVRHRDEQRKQVDKSWQEMRDRAKMVDAENAELKRQLEANARVQEGRHGWVDKAKHDAVADRLTRTKKQLADATMDLMRRDAELERRKANGVEAIDIGSAVRLLGALDIRATVEAVTVGRGGEVYYRVAWLHNGRAEEGTLHASQVEVVKGDRTNTIKVT